MRALLAVVLMLPSVAFSATFPPDANVIDVTKLAPGEASRPLANGADELPDDAAIRAGMDRCIERGGVLYFPAGTFIATDSIIWRRQVDGLEGARCRVVGLSKEMTTLRLRDNSVGFGSAAVRKNFLSMRSFGGNGNAAPQNGVEDITVEVGAGNPGAVAVDFLGNNSCQMRNVRVRGSGLIGIAADRPSIGPCLFKGIEVDGFARGIFLGNVQFSLTILDVVLKNQTLAGIDFSGNQALAIEGLSFMGAVPAIRYPGNGMLTVIGGSAMGLAGASSRAAIEVTFIPAPSVRHFLVRDFTSTGFAGALKVGAQLVGGNDIDELGSNPFLSLYPTTLETLHLPAERAPEAFLCGPNDWARPMGVATQSQDALPDHVAIQAALDSGKPCVYLPKTRPGGSSVNSYRIGQPLFVGGTVRVIDGLGNFIEPAAGYPSGQPMFQITGEECPTAEPLTLRNFWGAGGVFPGAPYWIEHASPRTLVLQDLLISAGNRGIRTQPGAGKLFVENVATTNTELNGTSMWAWQLNPEFFPAQLPNTAGIKMTNATARVIGFKTEQPFVHGDQSGGSLEIFGGFWMPGVGTGSDAPQITAFFLRNTARTFLNGMTWSSERNNDFLQYVNEIRGSDMRTLPPTAVDRQPATTFTRSFLTGYRSGE